MTSSSSLSAQAALQVAAVCNVASRGCRYDSELCNLRSKISSTNVSTKSRTAEKQ